LFPSSSPPFEISDSDDSATEDIKPIIFQPNISRKRARHSASAITSGEIIDISSDSDHGTQVPAKKSKKDWVAITRQLKVQQLVEYVHVPTCWPVPKPGCNIAYLLNLTDDSRSWTDSSGGLMSMAAIIKSEVWLFLNY
jgi:hypothetical protein